MRLDAQYLARDASAGLAFSELSTFCQESRFKLQVFLRHNHLPLHAPCVCMLVLMELVNDVTSINVATDVCLSLSDYLARFSFITDNFLGYFIYSPNFVNSTLP